MQAVTALRIAFLPFVAKFSWILQKYFFVASEVFGDVGW